MNNLKAEIFIKNVLRPKRPVLTAFIVIFLLGLVYNYKALNKFPYNIHAWTSADRYALAKGFNNNGLNFFLPETFVYNQQYPSNAKVTTEESITAVDFPLHDYIPAIFMKITGSEAPIIFRLYVLLMSMIGMLYAFKLALLWTNSFYKSLFVTLFAATSPVFAYYSGGFLPTIPSLATSIIGIYFYSKYFNNHSIKDFNLAIVFLTLASLTRTTFLIPLIAVLGFEFLRILRKESVFKDKLIAVLISFGTILIYFFYNGYLREKYGSIFLNYLIPAKSYEEAKEILSAAQELWGKQYFNINHYIIFFVLLAGLILSYLFRKQVKIPKLGGFGLLILIMLIGNILFAIMMMQQLRHHDYYFLDSFYLPCVYLIILLIAPLWIPESKHLRFVIPAIYLIAIIFMINKTGINQRNRLKVNHEDNITQAVFAYENADTYLDSLKIPRSAKILVLDGTSPNIALTKLDRKGFSLMFPTKDRIKEALTWNFDYIVFENENFIQAIYQHYPEIISSLKKIDDNGRISVCEISDKPILQTINRFIGIEGKEPVFTALMNYDSTYNSNEWYNINSTSKEAFSGKFSGLLSSNTKYGITFEGKNLKALTEKNRTLVFSSYFFHENMNECNVIVSIKEGDESIYYKSVNISDSLDYIKEWERLELHFNLPQVKSQNHQMSLYLFNVGKNEMMVDDFGFQLY